MKIMTFNVQHCANFRTGEIDLPLFAKTLAESGADVVGINEIYGVHTDPAWHAEVARLAVAAGYPYAYFAPALCWKGREYGNAILSKQAILRAETILIPDPPVRDNSAYETRAVLRATLSSGLTVLVTHFGLNRSEQENAVRTVVQQLSPTCCVLMGDFNVTPDDPLLDPIRARMKDAADAFPEELWSFPADVPQRKIDYVFVSPELTVTAADIPALVVSDHRPHTAEIVF